jgi:CRISP-associated protein Cas1
LLLEASRPPGNAVTSADDCAWAERCAYWQPGPAKTPTRRLRTNPVRSPLILAGHGIRLRVDHGALVVRDGFTHYPQQVSEHRFFPGSRDLPSRIVVIDGSGGLSFHVMTWLSEQQIPLVRVDWKGSAVSVIGGGQFSNPERVATQIEAKRNGKALQIATALIREKIENAIDTLQAAIPVSPARELAVMKHRRDAKELATRPPKSLSALLGIEGRVAQAYFAAWQSIPLRWKGLGRRAIPDDWHRVGQRQSLNSTRQKGRNRHASHPVNAMLNYVYAILETQVRIQVVAEGLDPTIGYLHTSTPERQALVLDMMEPRRPLVDRKVLEFVQAHIFHPADFTIRSDGVCRLNPQLSRQLIALSLSQGCCANTMIQMSPAIPSSTNVHRNSN